MPVYRFAPAKVLDRGFVSKILGWSFVAGTLPMRVGRKQTVHGPDVSDKWV